MSFERSPQVSRTELAPSKRLALLLSGGHGGGALIAIVLLPSVPWLALLFLLLIPSGAWTLRRYAFLRDPQSIVSLELKDASYCRLRLRNGNALAGRVLPSSYALPWLIVLHLGCEERRFGLRVLVFPDSVSVDMHRRLRVRLRWMLYGAREVDAGEPPL
jgi:toxin CptA